MSTTPTTTATVPAEASAGAANPFRRAVRHSAKARIALIGPANSGKTYSALLLAAGLSPAGRIAVIDTEQSGGEHGAAELYADLAQFDTVLLRPPYTVDRYLELVKAAVKARYEVIVVDSLSHVWAGSGGLLEQKDALDGDGTGGGRKGNGFANWAKITPLYNTLIAMVHQCPAHLVCTLRSKTAYELVEEVGADGRRRSVPRKVGLEPVMRDGLDYEFNSVLYIDADTHEATVTKDRTGVLRAGRVTVEAGRAVAAWLAGGAVPAASPADTQPAAATPAATPPPVLASPPAVAPPAPPPAPAAPPAPMFDDAPPRPITPPPVAIPPSQPTQLVQDLADAAQAAGLEHMADDRLCDQIEAVASLLHNRDAAYVWQQLQRAQLAIGHRLITAENARKAIAKLDRKAAAGAAA